MRKKFSQNSTSCQLEEREASSLPDESWFFYQTLPDSKGFRFFGHKRLLKTASPSVSSRFCWKLFSTDNYLWQQKWRIWGDNNDCNESLQTFSTKLLFRGEEEKRFKAARHRMSYFSETKTEQKGRY